MRAISYAVVCLIAASALAAQTPAVPRTILAIGAHAGDMELTTGALLIKQHKAGDRIVILHMTLGEGGNPKMSPAAYGAQKRREALAVDSVIGAETIFAPYKDGELPDDEAVRLYVANVIRQVKPTYVMTHWQKSIHKDHSRTSAIVQDAVLLASLEGVSTGTPPHRGLRGIWYADNWEDGEDFQPYIYVDVSNEMDQWRNAVTKYEFVGGSISSFKYLDYYSALAIVRGAVAGKRRAIAFNIDAFGKRRVLDALP
ncbi:MAG TPA: PIG-L family deacetylase [Gemmatimonadaceae bacterium]|nr:PIG-L family deacetylase [Gemmatimonadaceae bacterium]